MKLLELGERNIVILFIFIMSVILIVAAFYNAIEVGAVLALLGSWWGAVILYYFSKDNKND